jgi:hypothetical protein
MLLPLREQCLDQGAGGLADDRRSSVMHNYSGPPMKNLSGVDSRVDRRKQAVAIAVRNISGRRRWSKLAEWLRTGTLDTRRSGMAG